MEANTTSAAGAGDATPQPPAVPSWEEIVEQQSDRVYRLAYRLAGDEELARDFTQETFVRAFDRLGSFRGDSSLGTWLHAIGVSVALNGLRKVKRWKAREARSGAGWLECEPPVRAG